MRGLAANLGGPLAPQPPLPPQPMNLSHFATQPMVVDNNQTLCYNVS